MNYDNIYDHLITRAFARQLWCPFQGYKEKHHILPECLFPEFKDLKKHPENCAILTPEEHYLAHQLLVKMSRYKNHANYKGLVYGAHKMCSNSTTQKRNNKLYGWIKRKFSIVNTGWKHTEEALDAMSINRKIEIENSKKLCPHCRKVVGTGNFNRWHGDNCEKNRSWEAQFGKEKAQLKKKNISDTNTGENNPNCDKTLYIWYHIDGTIVECTSYELENRYKLGYMASRRLLSGDIKRHKGWAITLELLKYRYCSGKNNSNYDNTIYHWINKDGREEYLTRHNLCEQYKLSLDCIGKIIRNEQKYHKGWTVRIVH